LDCISGTKDHPRLALTRAELILHLMDEVPDTVGRTPTTVSNLAKFAVSAVDSSTQAVKKLGEKILLRYTFLVFYNLTLIKFYPEIMAVTDSSNRP
jgi:hypothetical protein